MAQRAAAESQFVAIAMKAPYLQHEEERRLAAQWRNERSEPALHRLAHAHMRLVIALAARFRHYGLPVSDLIQEGHVGLLEAAARFDPDREVRFSTYATWWIRASMQDFVLRNWSIVRGGTSSAQKALFFNLRRLRAKLAQGQPSEAATFARIAEALGVSRADVELMDTRLSSADMSLNAPLPSGDGSASTERIDVLVDDRVLPDAAAEEAIDTDRRLGWLNEALSGLSPRELTILRERRLADEAATLESLGGALGISKERVRQIETRALDKMRAHLSARHPEAAVAEARPPAPL